MVKQTTPLQNLKYVETVLKDVRAVLKKMHEDQAVPSEQRGKISGCLDEIFHALGTIEDDEVGLQGKLERLIAIETLVEPPVTKQWTRYRGSLLQCLEKAADTYYYQTQEDQAGHDWRVHVNSVLPGGLDLLEQIGPRVEQQPEAALPAWLDYDTSWFGESIKVDAQAEPLWVHAKLYVLSSEQGSREPIALIYRIDFEDEEESED